MKRLVFKLIAIFLFTNISMLSSNAQVFIDPYRLTQLSTNGTARSLGMANSFGVLGAESGAISNNPAGVAIYTHGELCFSLDYFQQENSLGNFKDSHWSDVSILFDQRLRFGPSNLSISFPLFLDKKNNFIKSWGLSLSYNKIGRFYDMHQLDNIWNLNETSNIEYIGTISEFAINAGINIKHMIYIGMGLSRQSMRYHEVYKASAYFTSSSYLHDGHNYFHIRRWHPKFGIILKPFQFLRFGAAYKTAVKYKDPDSVEQPITEPASITFSSGLVLGRFIALTSEYEFSNLSNINFSYEELEKSPYNYTYLESLGNNHKLKAGIELYLRKISIRAGYLTSFTDNLSDYLTNDIYSIGGSFNWDYANIDIAFTKMSYKNSLIYYRPLKNNYYQTNITYRLKF